MGVQRQTFFGPAPWGPGEGSKGQISFNFNYKVNFKVIYTKLCVCTHKRKIQNISDGIFILTPGSCPEDGTWGRLGAKIKFRVAVCPLCYLLQNHWTKFNQIWCASTLINEACNGIFLPRPLGPWGGVKSQMSFTKSISKVFIPNFVCVLTNERYKTYQTEFSFFCLGHAPGLGFWGAGGAQVVKNYFFQTWSCGISNRRG